MKTNALKRGYYHSRRPGACPYPNCPVRSFSAQKLLDGLLAAAIAVASVVIFLFSLV